MSSTSNHKVEHFEIPADNVENLKNFYTSLFGWQFEKGETQGYWMVKDAGMSGAVVQKENPQQLSTQFVTVESIEDYIDKAKQLGARVVKKQARNIRRILRCFRRSTKKYIWHMAR